jgi:hypothetical protein
VYTTPPANDYGWNNNCIDFTNLYLYSGSSNDNLSAGAYLKPGESGYRVWVNYNHYPNGTSDGAQSISNIVLSPNTWALLDLQMDASTSTATAYLNGIKEAQVTYDPSYWTSFDDVSFWGWLGDGESTITVTPSAGPHGSISPSTVQTVSSGGSVTFTGTPNAGYAVATWSLDESAVQTGGTTYTLSNITTSHTVSVTFNAQSKVFTVSPSAGANGTVSPSGPQTVNSGDSISLTATPATGYTVDTWSVDGCVVQAGGTQFTLMNVTAGHNVVVTFKTGPPCAPPLAGIGPDGSILYTSDMSSWKQVPGSLSALVIGDFLGTGSYGLAGMASDDSIWYTTDMTTWSNIPGQLTSLVVGDFDGNGSEGIAGLAQDKSIWCTTDLQDWASVPGSLNTLTAGNFVGSGYCGLAGTAVGNSLWLSEDLLTWSNIPGQLTSVVPGCFDGSGKDGIVGVAADGGIWYTSDLANWNNIPGELTSLVVGDFNGDRNADIAGLASDGSIWYTLDLRHWTNIPGYLTSLTAGGFSGDGKDGLAGLSTGGSIWYTTDMQNWMNIPGQLSTIVSRRSQ